MDSIYHTLPLLPNFADSIRYQRVQRRTSCGFRFVCRTLFHRVGLLCCLKTCEWSHGRHEHLPLTGIITILRFFFTLSVHNRSKLTMTDAVTVSCPGAVDGALAVNRSLATLPASPPTMEYPSPCWTSSME